ncbi:MAG: endonuclease III [Oscillospiraceae bacterium]|jgi:endonuclease-3|nr:endonuclease III [Oscillospiraceae bacterium]
MLLKQQKLLDIVAILKKKYKVTGCELIYKEDYELMVAGRLSARCRDERVNVVTSKLFACYSTLHAFVKADFAVLEKIIRPCGLSNTKAKDIINACEMIEMKFNGRLPATIAELVLLPGVGRKTANLLLAEIFHKPAVICDVHCIKISFRVGVCDTKDPVKVEKSLKAMLPPEESAEFCHRLVKFGREVCKTRLPKCEICELVEYCVFTKVKRNLKKVDNIG